MIIGFCGAIGAGKSSAALHLVKAYNFQRVPFAGPLKAMARAFGLSEAEINGDQKEVPTELACGKTPRQVMQYLGEEFGRRLLGPDVWVRAWRLQAVNYADVVADDVRYGNEVEVIRKLGGAVIRIVRDGVEPTLSHASERQVITADFTILNNGGKAELEAHIDRLYARLMNGEKHAAVWR